MKNKHVTLIILIALLAAIPALAQKTAVKSNLLYDATTTLNLGAELALSDKYTLDVSASYNPWTFKNDRKMKLWLLQPEARYWFCEKFNGHFLGAHLHGGQYNWGGMLPWGSGNGKMFGVIKDRHIQENRYQGWLLGAGVSYGYQWILSKRWSLEANIGVGYASLSYTRYPCGTCGSKTGDGHKNYFGPTKAGISLIYIIK